VAEVLRSVVDASDVSYWVVRKLATGRQARLFACHAKSERAACGANGVNELVVKLYREQGPCAEAAARDEYECLRRLHARLDGTAHEGWTVRCPRPLRLGAGDGAGADAGAGALVMTRVPGRPLGWHLGRADGLPHDVMDSVARATVSCLRRYWEGEGRLYGDLILDNVLCDLPSRTLSLVDPGMPEPFYDCAAAPKCWYPASRDLGFLLFWTGSLVRNSLVRPVLHARRKRMTALILRAFLAGLGSDGDRRRATAEIESCAGLHLGRLGTTATVKGLWQRVIKGPATATVDQLLRELRGSARLALEGTAAC
jgi:hypothetical protein